MRLTRNAAALPTCYLARRDEARCLFDVEAYGPQPGDRIITVRRRQPSELRRIVRWIGQHHWTAQIVLWLGVVTVCYLAAVLGMLFGAGIAPWLAS
jgi:hypothetical protein